MEDTVAQGRAGDAGLNGWADKRRGVERADGTRRVRRAVWGRSGGWAGGARRDTRVRAREGAPGSVDRLDRWI
jgi:hypothetical protein